MKLVYDENGSSIKWFWYTEVEYMVYDPDSEGQSRMDAMSLLGKYTQSGAERKIKSMGIVALVTGISYGKIHCRIPNDVALEFAIDIED